jgi:5-carboxymethyl-2-hydroxymuconate isomerase
MPHIAIDYSGNLEEALDIAALCAHLRDTAAGIEAFPVPGLRVRAHRADHWAVADGAPEHAYIDVAVRIREGRPAAVKEDAARRLYAALEAFVAGYAAERPLALSLELREIDAVLGFRGGSIRAHLSEAAE